MINASSHANFGQGVTSVPFPSSIATASSTAAPNAPTSSAIAPSSVVSSVGTAATSVPAVVVASGIDTVAPSSASVTASAAADDASASATPFTLPGKKLQVLPIGLGIFAGVTVIALIVVGLVTWERTKYRRVSKNLVYLTFADL